MEYKEYGHFSEDGREYVITERKTPRHWYNYYFNDTYNGFASQVAYGEGICQDHMGNRVFLVSDRCVYICDKQAGTWHTANGLPMSLQYDAYECRHGLGYSVITCEKDGIESEYTIFVPAEGDFEQWIVKIKNKRKYPAKLSVIGYCATETDHVYRPQGYNSDSAEFDKENNALCARVIGKIGPKKPGLTYGYMSSDGEIIGFDGRKNAFIGTYGSKDAPEALCNQGGCTNSDACVEKLCYALECACELAPDESKTICFQVGHAKDKEDLKQSLRSLEEGIPQKLLQEVRKLRLNQIDGVTIQTPDEKLNLAFNGFYKYSTNMGSRWARVRHNGYRDLASDTECFSAFQPEEAWKRFVRILSYQYSNGYAPRTFIDGQIKANNFSDCAVWLTFTAYAIIMELGDITLLDEEVPFNDGTKAGVFEHLRRAVEYLYEFKGMHGLIKIWGGDWNDGMNYAGLEGKGVSVWLSIAWYRANRMLMELAKLHGESEELIGRHEAMGEEMRQLIETYGYDGEYYITAINDLGEKIGSKESKEGKMYLNPQLWAVFAQIAPEEKLERIMEKVDQNLETPLGTLVNNPGYTECDPNIGNMTMRPLGTLINQAVYLHPMSWKLAVESIMKRPEKLQMTLEKILPWNHKWAVTYGEPYILYNFYHGPESGYREGTPGQSWRTATTAWVVNSLIRFVYGLKPCLEGMKLDPCLPPEWKECSITKKFRGCVYEIRYHQTGGKQTNMEVLVDGKKWTEQVLPQEKGCAYIVDVYLGR